MLPNTDKERHTVATAVVDALVEWFNARANDGADVDRDMGRIIAHCGYVDPSDSQSPYRSDTPF